MPLSTVGVTGRYLGAYITARERHGTLHRISKFYRRSRSLSVGLVHINQSCLLLAPAAKTATPSSLFFLFPCYVRELSNVHWHNKCYGKFCRGSQLRTVGLPHCLSYNRNMFVCFEHRRSDRTYKLILNLKHIKRFNFMLVYYIMINKYCPVEKWGIACNRKSIWLLGATRETK